jgi:flagellar biogenesis protein FliO
VILSGKEFSFKSAGSPRWFAICLCSCLCQTGFEVLAAPQTSANATVLPSALPDASASVVRVLGALIIVVTIFLGGVWLFKNWQRFTVQKGAGPRLSILEARSLGQRQSLYVVGYQQQRMLVAASPAGITLLSHLPAAEEADAPPVTKISFADAFQQVLVRKQ